MSQLQQYLQEQFFEQDKLKINIQDEIFKSIKENWNEKLGYVPQKPMALVTVTNPGESILQSVGCSEPDDIILNTFGAVFAAQYNVNAAILVNVSDVAGVVRTLRCGSASNVVFPSNNNCPFEFIASTGMQMQIGRNGSALPVARSDFQLHDPYVIGSESSRFNVTPGGWITGSQNVVVDGILSNVASTDTIGEAALIAQWLDTISAQRNIMITHDICGGAFSTGQNVNLTYTWSIT